MATSKVKRPRHYVEEIIALPTREERREALSCVPEHLSVWVENSVRKHFELKNAQRTESQEVPQTKSRISPPKKTRSEQTAATGNKHLSNMKAMLS